jgi:MFS family permease
MIALGLSDGEIGIVASVYMFTQVIFAFLSGVITDKLGRRKTTAIFDFISWCIPCLIWVRAEGFWYFIVAALFNGAMKVPTNSWDCLLVEDAEKEEITRIYSLVVSCSNLSALFAPISSILVSRLTLVPAIRILYINAFVVMTIKLVVLYIFSRETRTGVVRMRETRGQSVLSQMRGYGGVLRLMGGSRGTLFAIGVSTLVSIVGMVNTTFWQIIVSGKVGVPDQTLPLFPMIRSIISLVFFFTVIPRLTRLKLKSPLLLGFAAYGLGQAILILTPTAGGIRYGILCVSLIFDGFGAAMLIMLSESLVAIHVDPAERARVLAILQMIIMFISAPFGWIAGMLSGISRNLPFVLTLCLLFTGVLLTLWYYRKKEDLPQSRGS